MQPVDAGLLTKIKAASRELKLLCEDEFCIEQQRSSSSSSNSAAAAVKPRPQQPPVTWFQKTGTCSAAQGGEDDRRWQTSA